jgi:hypothetical protein
LQTKKIKELILTKKDFLFLFGKMFKRREKNRERERESTSLGGDRAPVTRAMLLDVRDKHEIFFRSPRSLLHPQLLTARWPPHFDPSNFSS